LTLTRKCQACAGTNGATANFCRHCGATLTQASADDVGTVPAGSGSDGALSLSSGAPALDERRLLRELCWLCGLPVAISVIYAVSVRVGGVSALASLVGMSAMATIALGSALMNTSLVRSALRLPKASDLLATVLVASITAPILIAAFWLLGQLGFALYGDYLTPYIQDDWPTWLGFVDLALVTPVSEELLFRGLIQPKLGQILNPSEALIVQAALFSAAHLSPVILVTHFVMGLAFGWLRRRSGSLIPGTLLHGAWNAWVVACSS
jgi:membrane protease YdiL (CAAX protease family)